ncbi:MAG: acylphosphatase [Candidatus Thermoplasmatota archaeon]|nr:acylphosphatase [Candidatus Thermoplasmatota archaeon]
MTTRVHVIISGRVQGVWFRASTKQKADELGLTGWVKNTDEGNVEAVFEGDTSKVDTMITWCWKGPPLAKVTDVKITRQQGDRKASGFVVLRKYA